LIDLHMHTTASDGRLSPAELVPRASAAGLTTISVTDHDTVASIADVTALAALVQIDVVPGIEITAVDAGRDVHMLGYFFDPQSATLASVLEQQRALRVSRVREIATRLSSLGMPIDVESVLLAAASRPGSSVGRPQVARELVKRGYVASVQEAFDLWLATGRPAFIERTGPSPAAIIDTIHAAGGLASMAHPGVTKRDELIAPLVEHGMDAIELYHSDHTAEDVQVYRNLAVRLGALVSGGSDFHGDDPTSAKASTFAKATADKTVGRPGDIPRSSRSQLGAVTLPPDAFGALSAAARRRQSSSRASTSAKATADKSADHS
jgi:3',5'-nucleoside bisphosphate phosphatase